MWASPGHVGWNESWGEVGLQSHEGECVGGGEQGKLEPWRNHTDYPDLGGEGGYGNRGRR